MPSRRDLIRMTEEELERILAGERTVTCATLGPNGRPHLMPLWYVPERADLLGLDLRQVAEGAQPGARSARHASDRGGPGVRRSARGDARMRRRARARR